jgi:hypothetical protein
MTYYYILNCGRKYHATANPMALMARKRMLMAADPHVRYRPRQNIEFKRSTSPANTASNIRKRNSTALPVSTVRRYTRGKKIRMPHIKRHAIEYFPTVKFIE